MKEIQEMWVLSPGKEDLYRRKGQPTPVFLSGKSHGQRSLASKVHWVTHKSDTMTCKVYISIFNWCLIKLIVYLPLLVLISSKIRFSGASSCSGCLQESWNYCLPLELLFSNSVVSESFLLHGLQHTMLLCPSSTPRVCTNSCPSSQWCHPTILSSIIPFSSCLQSFPASVSFPRSESFSSGGQGIRVSASASVLPMNIQGLLPLGLTGLISLKSKGLSRVFSNTTVKNHQFF